MLKFGLGVNYLNIITMKDRFNGMWFKFVVFWFNIVWILAYVLCRVIFRTLGRVEIEFKNKSNTSSWRAPMIIASNHKGVLDSWIIFQALPFGVFYRLLPVRPYAAKKFSSSNKICCWLDRIGLIDLVYFIFNVVKIDHHLAFDKKIAPLVRALKDGQSIFLFPEGRLNYDFFDIGLFKKGVVELHRQTAVPVLPCAIKYHRRGSIGWRISVRFGEPFRIPEEIMVKDDLKMVYLQGTSLVRKKVKWLYYDH